ncbi:hypothetical protein D3C78_1821860 [compost metagenome]
MKTYHLYLCLGIDVLSQLDSLSDSVREFEQGTEYHFSDTPNVRVSGAELLRTEPFNLNNNDHGTQFEL